MTFIVEGEPVAQGRPRFTKQGHAYDPPKSREYKKLVALKAKEAMRGREMFVKPRPLWCSITVYRPIPKTFTGGKLLAAQYNAYRPITRPDADNYVKGILDAMNGIVYEDDALVCRLIVEKAYGNPRVEIKIDTM